MQTKDLKDGPRPRPRSFVAGDSHEFIYDRHHGGLVSSGNSLDRDKKRPVSLYESLSQEMYGARRNSASSSRPDQDGGHRDGEKEFARLSSQEKADEVNSDKKMSSRSSSGDSGDSGLGTRKLSDASDSRKAARILYAELSSPPLKSGAVDEKFNAVSRLRSLFDQSKSAPPSQKSSVVVIPSSRASLTSTVSADRPPKIKDEGKNIEGKHEHVKLDFSNRRPKYERLEADKKRKLFAPPAAVKLDDLLKRDSPRSPVENKNALRFRRSNSKENEPPVEGTTKANDHKDGDVVSSNSLDLQDSRNPEKVRREEVFVIEHKTRPPHKERHEVVEKDRFELIHEKRRSLPKKRSSSFEFESLEDNVKVFGEGTIDINAILGLDPPCEDAVAEAKEEADNSQESSTQEKESTSDEILPQQIHDNIFHKKEERSDKIIEKGRDTIIFEKEVPEKKAREEISGGNVDDDEKFTDDFVLIELERVAKQNQRNNDDNSETRMHIVEDTKERLGNQDRIEVLESDFDRPVYEEIRPISTVVVESSIDEHLKNGVSDMEECSEEVVILEKDVIEEDAITPDVYESTESALDLDFLEANSESANLYYDSFDSFALNMKNTNAVLENNLDDKVVEMISDDEEECLENIKKDESLRLDNLSRSSSEEDKALGEEEMCNGDDKVGSLDGLATHVEQNIVTRILQDSYLQAVSQENVRSAVEEEHDSVDEEERHSVHEEEHGSVDEEERHSVHEEEHNSADEEEHHSLHEEEHDSVDEEKHDSVHEEEFNLVHAEEFDSAHEEEHDSVDDVGEDAVILVSSAEAYDAKQMVDEEEDEDAYSDVDHGGLTHETVELDDEEYDSDHDMSVSSGDTPHVYSFNQNLSAEEDVEQHEEDVEQHEEYIEPHEEYMEESYPERYTEETEDYVHVDESQDVLQLLPPPTQSCLASKKSDEKKPRKGVSFQHNIQDVIFTYSPEEYNRSNAEIDAITASAEWELEKRVDDKDIFSVDLDKSKSLGLLI